MDQDALGFPINRCSENQDAVALASGVYGRRQRKMQSLELQAGMEGEEQMLCPTQPTPCLAPCSAGLPGHPEMVHLILASEEVLVTHTN